MSLDPQSNNPLISGMYSLFAFDMPMFGFTQVPYMQPGIKVRCRMKSAPRSSQLYIWICASPHARLCALSRLVYHSALRDAIPITAPEFNHW